MNKNFGAGDGTQTRDLCLGKAALYQLSYSRALIAIEGANLYSSPALVNLIDKFKRTLKTKAYKARPASISKILKKGKSLN